MEAHKRDSKAFKSYKRRKKRTQFLVEKYKIDGIISDNRFGVHYRKVPCVFITHQLNVLSGNTTWFSTNIHQNIIKKFDVCWIPDHEFEPNLSGKLGHSNKTAIIKKYLGPLSRLKVQKQEKQYDLMVLLSGPEPHRTLLEKKITSELKAYKGTVLFVQGLIENDQIITHDGLICYYNFMKGNELQYAINNSLIILSRSGYTTVMDLAKMGKKAFFIPTPGQFEQEYLAKRFDDLKMVPTCAQDDFKIEMLEKVKHYSD
ncbi:glycosyltransferase [Lacinutrix neustonica]|uniref:glycosyltransferase n=1 Tax=Lacinutrix neustonica TaxID=2980107 RepID=UPI0028BD7966|nr:glycosyltransferase [Lacinutrix neustonica]